MFITPDFTPKKQEANHELRKRLAEMNGSGKVYQIKKKRTDSEEGGFLNSSFLGSDSLAPIDCISDSNSSTSIDDSPIMNSFKLISSNFRGLHSKKAFFLHLIESESPHFISGTESWLNSTVLSSEISPLTIKFSALIELTGM